MDWEEINKKLLEAIKKDKEKGLEFNFLGEIWEEKETIWDYLDLKKEEGGKNGKEKN